MNKAYNKIDEDMEEKKTKELWDEYTWSILIDGLMIESIRV